MRFPSLTPVLVVLIFSAACGSSTASSDGYDAADRVLAAVGANEDRVEVFDNGCERTVTIDEYGFETESVSCPEDTQTTAPAEAEPQPEGPQPGDPINADQLLAMTETLPNFVYEPLAQAAPEALSSQFVAIEELLVSLSSQCGVDLNGWRQSLTELADATDQLNVQITPEAFPEYVGTPAARALGKSLFERAIFQHDCAAPGALPLDPDAPETSSVFELTARASTSVAKADQLLSGSTMTRLFHFFSAWPNYLWLRKPVAEPQLVVLGSSQAGDAIEVPLLTRSTGVVTANAFVAGSLAEVQQYWVDEVYRYINPDTVIWLMGPLDFLAACVTPGRGEQFAERLQNRLDTFASSNWFSRSDPIDVVLGPAPAAPNANMGNVTKKPRRDNAGIAEQLPGYTDQFADSSFCVDRAEISVNVITQLQDWGSEVIVVWMPVNPEAVALIDGGADRVTSAIEELHTHVLEPTGAGFIDVSAGFEDVTLWRDLTHVTTSGAQKFTMALAGRLVEAGVGQ